MTRIDMSGLEGNSIDLTVRTAAGRARIALRRLPLVRRWLISASIGGAAVEGVPLALGALHFPTLPFDVTASAEGDAEPTLADDFATGRARLHLVEASERDGLAVPPQLQA